MAVQVKTTINDTKVSAGSLESRFVSTYSRLTSSRSGNAREMVLAGFILRELGICQQLLDKEQAGEFEGMTIQEKRSVIADLLSPRDTVVTPIKPKEPEPEQETVKPDIGSWSNIGG